MNQKTGKNNVLTPQICAQCGNVAGNTIHTVREMMFGSREVFRYLECKACESLRMLDIPSDLSLYYPDDYYSCAVTDPIMMPPLKSWLKGLRLDAWLGGKTSLGSMLLKRYGRPRLPSWLEGLPVQSSTSILEIGCGSGYLLEELRFAGFRSLLGIDPYVRNERSTSGGVVVLRRNLEELEGEYGLIISHHSFEHLLDPEAALAQIYRLMKSGGCALIIMPIAGTYAWRHYGVNWASLDAPRHIVLQSVKSMRLLASRCGLEVVSVKFNSTAFQFWASEQYVNDIPLMADCSYAKNPQKSMFSRDQIEEYEARAQELNAQEDGDEAVFVLRRCKKP